VRGSYCVASCRRNSSSEALPQENAPRSWAAVNRSMRQSGMAFPEPFGGLAQRFVGRVVGVQQRQEDIAVPVGQHGHTVLLHDAPRSFGQGRYGEVGKALARQFRGFLDQFLVLPAQSNVQAGLKGDSHVGFSGSRGSATSEGGCRRAAVGTQSTLMYGVPPHEM